MPWKPKFIEPEDYHCEIAEGEIKAPLAPVAKPPPATVNAANNGLNNASSCLTDESSSSGASVNVSLPVADSSGASAETANFSLKLDPSETSTAATYEGGAMSEINGTVDANATAAEPMELSEEFSITNTEQTQIDDTSVKQKEASEIVTPELSFSADISVSSDVTMDATVTCDNAASGDVKLISDDMSHTVPVSQTVPWRRARARGPLLQSVSFDDNDVTDDVTGDSATDLTVLTESETDGKDEQETVDVMMEIKDVTSDETKQESQATNDNAMVESKNVTAEMTSDDQRQNQNMTTQCQDVTNAESLPGNLTENQNVTSDTKNEVMTQSKDLTNQDATSDMKTQGQGRADDLTKLEQDVTSNVTSLTAGNEEVSNKVMTIGNQHVTQATSDSGAVTSKSDNVTQAATTDTRSVKSTTEITLSAPSQPKVEDYQPPEQHVKQEDGLSRTSASISITDSKAEKPTTPRMSAERENDTSAEYSVEPSKPFKALKQSWGTPGGGDPDNYCKGCNKRVYEMEKIYANNAAYHKACFRCSHCKNVLRLGNFACMEGVLYCKPHFMSMFKTKGNYDEGFGKEKHSKKWTNRDTPTKEGMPKESYSEEAYEDLPKTENLIRNYEDDLDGGQGSEVIRESQEKDTVHFTQLNSVRSKFESASHAPSEPTFTPKSSRTPSKWDKPKDATPPPPVVNRSNEEYSDESPGSDRGIRQLTPPPDMVDGEVREVYESEPVHDPNVVRYEDSSFREDELPPRSMAKNMVAKFRSMEDLNQPPLSPETNRRSKQSRSRSQTPQRQEPQPPMEPVTVNGGQDQETYLSSPEQPGSKEQEMPEKGITRNLVAQWKTREQPSPAVTPVSVRATSRTPKSTQKQVHAAPREPSPDLTPHTAQLANGDTADGHVTEVVHSGEPDPEDELPPPAMARNMKSMFENIAVEKQREVEALTPRSARKFKFTVRETGFHVKTPTSADTFNFDQTDHSVTQDTDDEGPFYENVPESEPQESPQEDYTQEPAALHESQQTTIIDEELPPTAFTRNMLAKFRSMEDLNQPPPTPEEAERHARLLARDSPHRVSNPNIRPLSVSSQGALELHGDISGDEHDEHEDPDLLDAEEEQVYDQDMEGGEFENEPEYNPNVVHEWDRNDEAEMPEQGTTRSLLAKFQSIQAH